MTNLSPAVEQNSLTLVTREIKIKPFAAQMYNGVEIHLDGYNTNDLLGQLIEEYGKEELIDKIKNL